MAATIRDVARQAGVSVATVSRVLNGSGPVAETTRRRVEEAATSLRYIPNGAARSLITRRTRNLGVILPDLYGEFFSQLIRGMDQAAQGAGYHLLLSGSHAMDEEVEAALGAMRGRVDGLVLMSPDITATFAVDMVAQGVPVVLVNSGAPVGAGAQYDTLSVDNRGGAYAMVRHLMDLGHERIGLIAGNASNHDARERRAAFRSALHDGGLDTPAELEVAGDFTKSGGYAAGLVLAGLENRPTAVFAANDSMAVGAMSAFQELGLAVPGQVAVAGFDDIPLARYITPQLSTVHVDLGRLGERAVELLLGAIRQNGGHERHHEVMDTTLVIRRSCGSPSPESGRR